MLVLDRRRKRIARRAAIETETAPRTAPRFGPTRRSAPLEMGRRKAMAAASRAAAVARARKPRLVEPFWRGLAIALGLSPRGRS